MAEDLTDTHVTTASAAASLGVSRQWVHRLLREGRLQGTMIAGRQLVTIDSLRAYQRENGLRVHQREKAKD